VAEHNGPATSNSVSLHLTTAMPMDACCGQESTKSADGNVTDTAMDTETQDTVPETPEHGERQS
jgi:hypothetical protein